MAQAKEASAEYEEKVTAFVKRLRAFLKNANHHETGNDWPSIPHDELSAGGQLAAELFALKWGEDCDGSSPIRSTLFDRQRFRLAWEYPLAVEPRGDESLGEAERRLLSNLRTIAGAMSAYSHELRIVEDHLERIRLTRATRAAAFQVYLVSYARPENYEPALDRPVSLHLTDVAYSKFESGGFTRRQVQALWAVPELSADPADDFAAFRAKVAAACEKVVPRRATLTFANLVEHRPTAD